MGYCFRLAASFFYMHHPTFRITHTTLFVTPVVEHWLEREIAQSVHHEGSIERPIASISGYRVSQNSRAYHLTICTRMLKCQ